MNILIKHNNNNLLLNPKKLVNRFKLKDNILNCLSFSYHSNSKIQFHNNYSSIFTQRNKNLIKKFSDIIKQEKDIDVISLNRSYLESQNTGIIISKSEFPKIINITANYPHLIPSRLISKIAYFINDNMSSLKSKELIQTYNSFIQSNEIIDPKSLYYLEKTIFNKMKTFNFYELLALTTAFKYLIVNKEVNFNYLLFKRLLSCITEKVNNFSKDNEENKDDKISKNEYLIQITLECILISVNLQIIQKDSTIPNKSIFNFYNEAENRTEKKNDDSNSTLLVSVINNFIKNSFNYIKSNQQKFEIILLIKLHYYLVIENPYLDIDCEDFNPYLYNINQLMNDKNKIKDFYSIISCKSIYYLLNLNQPNLLQLVLMKLEMFTPNQLSLIIMLFNKNVNNSDNNKIEFTTNVINLITKEFKLYSNTEINLYYQALLEVLSHLSGELKMGTSKTKLLNDIKYLCIQLEKSFICNLEVSYKELNLSINDNVKELFFNISDFVEIINHNYSNTSKNFDVKDDYILGNNRSDLFVCVNISKNILIQTISSVQDLDISAINNALLEKSNLTNYLKEQKSRTKNLIDIIDEFQSFIIKLIEVMLLKPQTNEIDQTVKDSLNGIFNVGKEFLCVSEDFIQKLSLSQENKNTIINNTKECRSILDKILKEYKLA